MEARSTKRSIVPEQTPVRVDSAAVDASSPQPPTCASPGPTALATPAEAAVKNATYEATSALDRRVQFEQDFRDVQRVCVMFGAMLLPNLGAIGWSYHTQSNDLEIEFGGGAALYLVIAGFALAWRHEWQHLMRRPVAWSRRWLVLTTITPLCSIIAAGLLSAACRALGLPIEDLTHGYGEDRYPLWLLFVWIAVLPPFFEEIAFRGVLLAKLQRLMGSTQAIWVTAVLFGVVHFSVLSMAAFLVPLAAVAGYLTRKTGSLLPAIGMHALHNTGAVLMSLAIK